MGKSKLGEAVLELRTDSKGFTKAIDKAKTKAEKLERTFGKVKSKLKALGGPLKGAAIGIGAIGAAATVAAGAIFLMTKRFAQQADELAKTSKALGIGVEQLQQWQFGVERSGGSAAGLVKGITKLRIEFERLALGETSEIDFALEKLDVRFRDATGAILPLETILPRIADKFKALKNDQEKASLAALLFGTRIGLKLVPFLNEGSEGIAALSAEAAKYGLISEKSAALSEGFVDAQRNLSQAFTGVKSIIGEELLPAFTDVIQELTNWIAANKELIGQRVTETFQEIVEIAGKLIPLLRTIANLTDNMIAGFNILLDKFESVEGVIARRASRVGAVLGPEVQREFSEALARIDILENRLQRLRPKIEQGLAVPSQIKAFKDMSKELRTLRINVASYEIDVKRAGKSTNILATGTPTGKGTAGGVAGLSDKIEKLNKAILKQVDAATLQFALLGKTKREQIEYNTVLQIASGVNADYARQLEGVLLAIEGKKERIAAIKETEALTESLQEQIKELEKEIDVFGLTAGALIDYEANILLAAGANEELVATIVKLKKELIQKSELAEFSDAMQESFETLESEFLDTAPSLIDRIADSFFNLGNNVLITSQVIGDQISKLIGAVGDFVRGTISDIISGDFSLGSLAQSVGPLLSAGGAVGGAIIGGAVGGPVGAVIGATIGEAIGSIIGELVGLLGGENEPRLDIEIPGFGGNVDEYAEAIANGMNITVQDFLDAATDEALQKSLIFIDEKFGDSVVKAEVRQGITDVINASIEGIADMIGTLPEQIAGPLLESFQQMDLDLFQTIDDFLLEFDENGTNIAEKLALFMQELAVIRFPAAVKSIFVDTLEAAGVSAEAAAQFVQEGLVDPLLNIESREGRIAAGEQFLETFGAFMDAFNLVHAEGLDQLGQSVERAKTLSDQLGFVGLPTLETFTASLATLIEEAEIDPSVVEKYKELRDILIQTRVALAGSVSSLVGLIQRIGAQTGNVSGIGIGALQQAAGSLTGLLNQGGLSLDEREDILNQLASIVDQIAAIEQGAAGDLLALERESIQIRISGLQSEQTLINEIFNARIEGLNEELAIAEEFKALSERIADDLQGILFSANSPLTGIEQFSMLQADIANASGANTAAEIDRLRELLTLSFQVGTDAFGAGSAESFAIFEQVTSELERLQGITEDRGRSVEVINAEIERLTAINAEQISQLNFGIEILQSQLTDQVDLSSQISQNTADLFNFIEGEAIDILEQRLDQLGEFSSVNVEQMDNLLEQTTLIADFQEQLLEREGESLERLDKSNAFLEFLAETLAENGENSNANLQLIAELIAEAGTGASLTLRDISRGETGRAIQRRVTGVNL